MLGLRRPDEDDASLRRNLFGVLGGPMIVAEDDSLYSVDESVVLTEVVGDPGRAVFTSFARAYARSLSVLLFWIAYKLNSAPFAVRFGFVMGAEMADVVVGLPLRRPCEIVPTGTGDRGEGPSLSYGTDRSLRSRPDNEGCLDL